MPENQKLAPHFMGARFVTSSATDSEPGFGSDGRVTIFRWS